MLKVACDNVTVSLEDHLIAMYVEFVDNSDTVYKHITGEQSPPGWRPKFDVNFEYGSKKCF